MAQYKNTIKRAIEIEELVLLACPVQNKTMHHLEDPMFKKVYALYASLDILQILAPQQYFQKESTDKLPYFSLRRFVPHPKLAQIKIKINGYSIAHTTFSSPTFTCMLPTILNEIENWQADEQQYPSDLPKTRRLMSVYTE